VDKGEREMRNVNVKTVIVLLISILLISPTFLRINTAQPPATTNIYVDPPSLTLNTGLNFTINIDIENVMNLWQFGFYLNYTATLMNATGIVLGPFLFSPRHVILSSINNTEGLVIFAAKSDSGAPPASGGGILASVNFTCLGEGTTPLHLFNTVLLDSLNQPILHGTIDGNVTQQSPWYVKPSYPDYAPSGMPDFDERQDNWGRMSAQGYFTWCVPCAVADSLWWLDSEYESLMFANPVPPPAISDHFNLVNSSNPGVWDDHDPNNTMSFISTLALLLDTDGMASGDGHNGTRLTDIQAGIQKYLAQQGVAGMFEVHNQSFPSFTWIDNQTEKCQDVELCIEFWQQNPDGTWTNASVSERIFQFGHCIACAGVNATTSQVLVCDPGQDAYQGGWTPGRSPVPQPGPFNTSIHNDAKYVSQDAYNTILFDASILPPPLNTTPPGYPQQVWELQNYLGGGFHAFIRYAFAVSPQPANIVPVNVESSKDNCLPNATVCKGYTTNVSATVVNQGSITQDFTVTVYANSTALGTATVKGLAPGANVTLIVATWNTSTWAYGKYLLTAATNASFPTFTSNVTVWVVIPGDINGDGTVDLSDAIILSGSFLAQPGDSSWNPNADINDDGIVDLSDAIILSGNFLATQVYDP
jgi:hypothetical protein